MVESPYTVRFKVSHEDALLCNNTLSTADLVKFRKAIKEDYYFQAFLPPAVGRVPRRDEKAWPLCPWLFLPWHVWQMFLDDLPTWGFIGNFPNRDDEETYLLFTNVHFDMSHNKDRLNCKSKSTLWACTQVLGGIVGNNSESDDWAPCHTINYPRETSTLPWYRQAVPQMVMAGLVPFIGVFVELYYLFASLWGHKMYTVYSILFVVFIMLLMVTALISIAVTNFQLANENHEWCWRSVLCGGSTGIYIYGYCFYYYYARSDMQGFMQISFFFGYMACLCYGVFLMLASVGYCASFLFVRHINQYGMKSSCEELTKETASNSKYMMEEHFLQTIEESESSSSSSVC
eukprot:SM000036S13371  [mRNA]  locus=s36:854453:857500:- [translate_table: standard]